MTVPQIYTRLFHHPEGEEVLKHLKKITLERTLSPTATDAELRFMEGQRALVSLILSFIKQGQKQGENICPNKIKKHLKLYPNKNLPRKFWINLKINPAI